MNERFRRHVGLLVQQALDDANLSMEDYCKLYDKNIIRMRQVCLGTTRPGFDEILKIFNNLNFSVNLVKDESQFKPRGTSDSGTST